MTPEDAHTCTVCSQRHKPSEGSLQGFKKWLVDKVGQSEADSLTLTFQMIKNLRKQYPIHDHYVTANNIRQVRKEIEDANTFFGIIEKDYGYNAAVVTSKFTDALKSIKSRLESI